MKKILFLASQVQGNGGIPRFNRNLISALQQKEAIDLHVLSLNDSDVEGIGTGVSASRLKFIWRYLTLLITYRPNMVIIGLLNFAPLSLISFVFRSKVAVILHGIEAWYSRKKLKSFYFFIDEFWAVSFYTKHKFSSTNNVDLNKVKRIFNTIPDEWVHHSAKPLDASFFLSVTRLDKNEGYKGVDKTIEAIKSIEGLMREKGFQYIVVGSGTDLDRHIALVKARKIEDLILFKTKISDKILMELYRDCSFFILPSSGEGFGIVFLEAMAFSKPCIGASNCGTEDVIDNGVTGFLIEPESEFIEEKLKHFILNQESRKMMGEAGYFKLKEEYTFNKFKQKIHSLI
jgi:glycosyltransferase involved in cell wall biosynthesis